MKQYFVGTKLIVIIMISCVLYSIYLWLEDLRCAFLHQIFIGIKTFYSYPLFENVYYWAACGTQLWNGQNSGRLTQKSLHVSLPLQWGRFMRGGDGTFQVVLRMQQQVDLERTKNYCVEFIGLTSIFIQYSMMLLACAGTAVTMPSYGPHGKFFNSFCV